MRGEGAFARRLEPALGPRRRAMWSARLLVAVASAFAILVTGPARAGEPAAHYPSRNIMLIVPFAPGGPPDVVARVLGERLGEILDKPVVVENRPGASTAIGAGFVARAEPDGYTLLSSSMSQAVIPSIVASLSFDPVNDLKPVSLVARAPFTVVIDPQLPIKTVADLVAYAKLKPLEIKAGHAGVGSAPHLGALSLMQATGTRFLLVPYRGVANAIQDVAGGHIQLVATAPSTSIDLARAGKIRMLGVSGDKRLSALPDVPTFKESGIVLSGFDRDTWFGVSAPAGLPDALVAKLNGAINAAIATPSVVETLARVDMIATGSTPAEYAALLAQQVGAWRAVLQDAGVRPE